ncbi:hypothetical protein DDZ14_07315 [Maritimibacter sp. 55A14]|uniref:lipid II:glycine glycyltransferase FemX n=1 Tax=Maritimibacter sp. 55A14 TaxID=2174844 RepID=UPI000D61BB26|nr:GNAT family N-acetyltransferase [Maritimibacter sp. 55A14]PWE32894.1 hypothetical protein DDZ14_07315 [Maritimibacter sp. 55A14]
MTGAALLPRAVTPADWPAVSQAFRDLTFEQTLTYGQAAARRIGAETQFLALDDEGGTPVAAACLRLKRVPGLGRGIAWIAAGPLMCGTGAPPPEPAQIQAILAALRAHVTQAGHILRLRLPATAGHDPQTMDEAAARAGFHPSTRAAAYRSVAIDLKQDEDALLAGLHGKWRNPLRGALKAGLELETGPIAEMSGRFDALYRQVQAAKGFNPEIPPEFYYDLEGPDFAHGVLIARKDGTDLGGFTLGLAGGTAVYLFGATAEAGRKLNAGHFLMWQAMLHARARGMHCLDLGGIDAEANPTVTRFKRRTGGAEVTAPGPYEARPTGPGAALVGLAETVHAKLRARR